MTVEWVALARALWKAWSAFMKVMKLSGLSWPRLSSTAARWLSSRATRSSSSWSVAFFATISMASDSRIRRTWYQSSSSLRLSSA